MSSESRELGGEFAGGVAHGNRRHQQRTLDPSASHPARQRGLGQRLDARLPLEVGLVRQRNVVHGVVPVARDLRLEFPQLAVVELHVGQRHDQVGRRRFRRAQHRPAGTVEDPSAVDSLPNHRFRRPSATDPLFRRLLRIRLARRHRQQ